jgi:small-conductance mechanosensitive channel
LLTIVIGAVGLLAYGLLKRKASKTKAWGNEEKRTFLIRSRNMIWAVSLGIIFLAWSKTLFPFLFSILALTVALVMATKEWILCWLGSLYRAATVCYRVGDHISIFGIRGEVIDIHWLQTRVWELGPLPHGTYSTGTMVTFPNSWLFQHTLKNETFFREYGFYWLTFPLTVKDDIPFATETLITEASKVCEPFIKEAHDFLSKVQHHLFMEETSVKPKVHLEFTGHGMLLLHLRFPAPKGKNNDLSQSILRNFLAKYTPSIEDKWEFGVKKPD